MDAVNAGAEWVANVSDRREFAAFRGRFPHEALCKFLCRGIKSSRRNNNNNNNNNNSNEIEERKKRKESAWQQTRYEQTAVFIILYSETQETALTTSRAHFLHLSQSGICLTKNKKIIIFFFFFKKKQDARNI